MPEGQNTSTIEYMERLFQSTQEARKWVHRAACKDTDTSVFYQPQGNHADEAKKICAKCPVRKECLDYAIHNCERFGIWGGLSTNERKQYKRDQRKKRKSASPSAYPSLENHNSK